MPEKLPNDDLLAEVLNQDPNYVKVRDQKEASFKYKYKPNSSFNWLVLFQNSKFAIYSGVSAVLILVIVVFWQSLRLDLLDQKTDPKQANIAANTNSSTNNTADLSSKTQNSTNGVAASPNTQEKSSFDQNTALVETSVKNEAGSEVKFIYDKNRNIVNYAGKITVSDGCTILASSKLESTNSSFALKYKLKRSGEICTQIMGEVSIFGNLQIKLSQEQIQNFENLFKLEKDLQ